MKNYGNLTKAELIQRLKAVEAKIAACDQPQPIASATQLEAPETALRDSAERLRAILETAVEGIITINERGIVESMNPAAERMFGYEAAAVIGKNVTLLMPSPYREEHQSYLGDYVRTGHAKIIGIGREVVGQRRDGTLFPMDLAVSEVRLTTRRLFTGFVHDITVRRQLEKALLEISDREQRRIGQDLHDGLGQHLAGIELMTQVLEQKLAAKKMKAETASTAEISRHVREAISQTRLLARGLSPVVLESEGLMAALQDLADSTEQMFRISCEFLCEQPVLFDDHVAAVHLYRIAQEAVSNAIRHGKTEKILIRLQKSDERVVLAVKDFGVGISETPGKKGMGLHIMQYRAGMIGGSLVVQRDPDGGTSVVCSLRKGASERLLHEA
jgi:PAS domain S-box-containing protein